MVKYIPSYSSLKNHSPKPLKEWPYEMLALGAAWEYQLILIFYYSNNNLEDLKFILFGVEGGKGGESVCTFFPQVFSLSVMGKRRGGTGTSFSHIFQSSFLGESLGLVWAKGGRADWCMFFSFGGVLCKCLCWEEMRHWCKFSLYCSVIINAKMTNLTSCKLMVQKSKRHVLCVILWILHDEISYLMLKTFDLSQFFCKFVKHQIFYL